MLADARAGRRWSPVVSTRGRILGWYLLLLGLALLVSVVVTRTVLAGHVAAQIDRELRHEVDEIRALSAHGTDAGGRRFTSLGEVLQAAVGNSAPETNATVVGYLDGRPYVRSAHQPIVRLDTDPRLTAIWGTTRSARLGSAPTRAGEVRYAAIPVTIAGDRGKGVVVAAVFVKPELRIVAVVTTIMIETGLGALLVGSLLAWLVAGRILAPVRHVTALARTMSETDLTRRLPVPGHDEISMLAATFNAMLERLETAFAGQRSFVADAGHELRTPLTIIRGNLEMLAADLDDPAERRVTVALVTDELDRMTRMIDDLLTLAKSQRPEFLQLEAVDVAALTAELIAKAAALAERDWVVDGSGVGTVVADRQRVSQAVLELAQNAARHTAPGDRIALGSAVVGDESRFWVRDCGPGVASADRERIFSRFTRSGPRRGGNGAGLGLSIVRSIAQAHAGRVELDSSATGATFTLVIGTVVSPANGSEQEGPACPES